MYVPTTISLSEEHVRMLKTIQEQTGVTISVSIRRALRAYFTQNFLVDADEVPPTSAAETQPVTSRTCAAKTRVLFTPKAEQEVSA
jgi:hypothetical protein